mmetsp:Transcript_34695/g.70160  ORF Transcript_34695/g.70160 Transcript_34695/m.70160 type:complete len:403 (+) Transcript_34695:99-1307(+)
MWSVCGRRTVTMAMRRSTRLTFLVLAAVRVRAFTRPAALTRSFSSRTFAVEESHTSGRYSLDPHSSEARELTSSIGISREQHDKLAELASLVVDWNSRINLVSRKDCSVEVVFGRHVLPSAALCTVPDCPIGAHDTDDSEEYNLLESMTLFELKEMLQHKGRPVQGKKAELVDRLLNAAEDGNNPTSLPHDRRKRMVADVGTGGGFPGLPLAIVYPNVDFLLIDSVGKKLNAVRDMVEELGLDNVRTHHGRVEELVDDPDSGTTHLHAYDTILGRSVTALPRFCFWVSDLMRREGGKLLYIVGGDVEELVTSQVEQDLPIDNLLNEAGVSDKRVLVFSAAAVRDIASKSGQVKPNRGGKKIGSRARKTANTHRNNAAKGHWKKRDSKTPKQRGYEGFNRFES